MKIKVRKVGNSLGMILPRDVAATLRVAEGDSVTLTKSADGYRITADPDVERQVEAGKRVMRRYRNTLRELAK